MGKRTNEAVSNHRVRQRALGLRPVRLWLPDTRTPEFAAQVARDIADARLPETPEEQALSDAWERAGSEDWPEWIGPDLTKPDDKV